MEEKKHICKYCGQEFEEGRQLGSHYLHCIKNPKRKDIIEKVANKRRERGEKIKRTLICEYCGNSYELYLSDKEFESKKYRKCCSKVCSSKLTLAHSNKEILNYHRSESLKNYYKENRKHYICECCGKDYTLDMYYSFKYCSKLCSDKSKSKKLSNSAKRNNFGGYNELSINKCYQGWYHGIHCDSSWELAFILWNELHNNKIQRYTSYFLYEYKGKQYKYYPDFIVNDKDIYEIKGYYSSRAKAKHEQNPNIILLLRNDLIPIIEEVEKIYGKDFIKLYE